MINPQLLCMPYAQCCAANRKPSLPVRIWMPHKRKRPCRQAMSAKAAFHFCTIRFRTSHLSFGWLKTPSSRHASNFEIGHRLSESSLSAEQRLQRLRSLLLVFISKLLDWATRLGCLAVRKGERQQEANSSFFRCFVALLAISTKRLTYGASFLCSPGQQ